MVIQRPHPSRSQLATHQTAIPSLTLLSNNDAGEIRTKKRAGKSKQANERAIAQRKITGRLNAGDGNDEAKGGDDDEAKERKKNKTYHTSQYHVVRPYPFYFRQSL
ncbi:hypothetical protein EYR38_008664 [Pleurotus pulmonarius]|nr:hypothetical protein EYR38_008664 [Pleurotus pulmonarius]